MKLITTIIPIFGLITTLFAFPIGPTTNYPATNSIYHSITRNVTYDSAVGKIFRAPGLDVEDLSTVVMFYFGATGPHVGKKCQFNFELSDSRDSKGGGQLLDVHLSKTNILSNTTLPEMLSNYDGTYLGRLRAVMGGQARPESELEQDAELFRFPCPVPENGESVVTVSYEVSPVKIETDIQWNKQHGPWIQILPDAAA